MIYTCYMHTRKKDFVMSNFKNLKDKHNEDEIKYFIVNKMSVAVKEQYRQTNKLIKEVKGNKSGSS